MDCLFCKIIGGEIPSEKIYEDDDMYAFKDIDPQAPVHFLVIPKKHIQDADALTEEEDALIGRIFRKAGELARDLSCDKGYRIVNNCKEDGGQTVNHLHFHILGQRSLQWPPG